MDLHDGDERGVQVVRLGLARVQDLHGVPSDGYWVRSKKDMFLLSSVQFGLNKYQQ